MNRRIGTTIAAMGAALYAVGAAAHTGSGAHAHPGHGSGEGLWHWLSGVAYWPGSWELAITAAVAVSAAIVCSRLGRRSAPR